MLYLRGRGGRLRRQFADLLDLRAGSAVLDVGSGTGSTALALAAVVGETGSVTGVDPSPPMVAAASAKTRSRRGVRFLVAAAQALPFPDASYDAVLSVLVMHHVPDELRATACREILRVLRPGGQLLIGDFEPPSGGLDRWVGAHRFRHPISADHLPRLADQLADAGAVDVHRHASPLGWLGLLHARRPELPRNS